ncbi:unnamed protein product [Closterium sp. NIES-64]|nr:unnamed protein product [Closterium sp. NIES-64]
MERVGITAHREAPEEQETTGGEAAAAEAAGGSGAMGSETEVAATVEDAAAAGLEGVAAEATETTAAAEPGGPDAASGGGSASPSPIPQARQPGETGPPVAQEPTVAVELTASPEPVTASAPAAVATAATGEQGGARTEEDAPVADRAAELSGLPAPPAGKWRLEPGQHRGGPEQGWDLVPRDPSWAGFCKGSCHKGKSVICHLREQVTGEGKQATGSGPHPHRP